MEVTEIRKALIGCLNCLNLQKESTLMIALSLESEKQMLTMMNWLRRHEKEHPSEDQVIMVARNIQAQVS